MPSKKKKYNARFPAGRIKKIMQSDEEIGKVAQAVPVIISRTLELFVESLLTKTLKITNSRNAKTLSPSHMKQCIMAENRFDFLRELVKNIPDISVAEEAVSNDSSPEATTIDPSDIPYDLSMPSTSSNSNNEISIQKDLSSNGTSSVIRNNGVTRSCGTTVVANLLKSHSTNLSSGGSGVDSRAELKRQWDVISRIQNPTTFASMSQSTETSTPPKLFRTDSAPAGLPRVPQLPIATTITSTTIQQHHEQQHQQPNPQLLPTDLRRLRHQPKSVPGNICSDIQTASQINHSKSQTQATAIPAPIVSIDFCNKPVVKIDYSNLALHDTNYSESISSSSSSPTVDQPNRSYINKAKLASPITTAPESPVINIDLSNIVTSGTFTASAVNASVTSPMSVPPTPTPAAPIVAYNKNSFLELDEDYDNI